MFLHSSICRMNNCGTIINSSHSVRQEFSFFSPPCFLLFLNPATFHHVKCSSISLI